MQTTPQTLPDPSTETRHFGRFEVAAYDPDSPTFVRFVRDFLAARHTFDRWQRDVDTLIWDPIATNFVDWSAARTGMPFHHARDAMTIGIHVAKFESMRPPVKAHLPGPDAVHAAGLMAVEINKGQPRRPTETADLVSLANFGYYMGRTSKHPAVFHQVWAQRADRLL